MNRESESSRGKLSREAVLAAALDVVDREGLEALSMRRLAADLGVEPMALYHHASSKEGLLDGLVERVFDEAHQRLDAGTAKRKPRAELHRVALTFYDVATSHAQVLPLVTTRLLSVPLARRPGSVLRLPERVLTLLIDAGVDERSAIGAYRAFSAWVLGYAIVDLRAVVDAPEEPDPAFRLGLHRLHMDYPRLRALAPIMAEGGGEAEFRKGLDALMDTWGVP
ncbi:MAG: TetR family transcriptional regulator [Streptomycetaceae bacterium]|nr:TetR family transcriptional regulator [Streptomycetaceae bacterium]